MPRTPTVLRDLIATGLALASLTLVGCDSNSGGQGADGGNAPISVTASDTECRVSQTTAKAGTLTFEVKNTGTQVTEFYLYAEGDRIMGEVENIGPGLSRKLMVELAAGKYQTACKPGMRGNGIRGDFTVTGSAPKQVSMDAKLAEATTSYHRYVTNQSAALVERTAEFVAAVKAGDIARAKALFPVSRTHWERIEPVAEIFGDLDPAIDARENDIEPGQQFTGFHRLEKDLWVTGDVSKSGPIADKLVADVKKVAAQIDALELTPLQLANGSKELLDEVATFKITGEEDRYSHTDLWDFAANVEGSQAAIASLRPVLTERQPALLAQIDATFAVVDNLLAKHEKGDGYRYYTELSPAEIKELAAAIDALGEPVSKVAAVVAKR